MTLNQKEMVYWITERESIRNLKSVGELPPWSDNPVMQNTYFCNVNREDDKVTKWLRDNWKYPDGEWGPSVESYDFAMIAARLFNLPATLESMGQPIDGELDLWLENAAEVIRERQSNKLGVWNGAYIVSTNGKKMPKSEYCLYLLDRVAKQQRITYNCKTLAIAHKELMKVEGLASFLSAQVVADLKNTTNHPLANAKDWWTFSAHGPGSLRGLSWFFDETVTARTYNRRIVEARDILEFEIDEEILGFLCNQNLQNCFCEYDKFMRVTKGTGRSKRKYSGTGK